jgi:hypothetical protein
MTQPQLGAQMIMKGTGSGGHAMGFAEHAGLVRGEIDGAIRDDNIGPSICNRHSRHIWRPEK